MVVSTGLHDRADLAWWAPYLEKGAAARREGRGVGAPPQGFFAASAAASADAKKEAPAVSPSEPEPWLPAAVTVEVDSAAWDVRVKQGRSVGDLVASAEEAGAGKGAPAAADGGGVSGDSDAPKKPESSLRATYELTSVVAHLEDPETDDEDDDEEEEEGEDGGSGGDSDRDGSDAGGRGLRAPPSRSVRFFSAASASSRGDGEGHLVTHVRVPASYLDSTSGIFAAGAGKEGKAKEEEGNAEEGGVTGERSGGGVEADESATPTWLLINDFAIIPTDAKEPRRTYGSAKAPALLMFTRVEEAGDEAAGANVAAVAAAAQTPPQPQPRRPLPPPPPPPPVRPARLLSDAEFVSLCARGEVGSRSAAAAAAASAAAAAAAAAAAPSSFVPFGLDELPRPGDLFGLDAEFVALAPALREMRTDGEIVETRPARLGLARVSVVRGGRDGGPSSSAPPPPLLNVPAIDDYIRQNEPVFDYLTRWSGLRPADLDPASTLARGGAPLATLKEAYAKLAHLVAAGATFVGHGLAQDFRMINIVVPPDQVVDTVHLFHLGEEARRGEVGGGGGRGGEDGGEGTKRSSAAAAPGSSSCTSGKPNSRGRKLSLRFLVSRLLGNADFQSSEHDSVEDARAALALYEKWRELKREGKLEETLEALYEYGRSHGFDPSANSSSGGGVVFGQ